MLMAPILRREVTILNVLTPKTCVSRGSAHSPGTPHRSRAGGCLLPPTGCLTSGFVPRQPAHALACHRSQGVLRINHYEGVYEQPAGNWGGRT